MVSYITTQPKAQKVEGLTIHTTVKEIDVKDESWRTKDLILSVILILSVGLVWVYFS